MVLLKRNSVIRWSLIILFFSILLILVVLIFRSGEWQLQYYTFKYLPFPAKRGTSAWLEYRDNWDGEILISIDQTEKEVEFSDEYQTRMRSKGFHPLSMMHERYHDRVDRMENSCDAFSSELTDRFSFKDGRFRVLFNDEIKLLQCSVPKDASSTWLSLFMKMINPDGLTNADKYTKWDRISLLYNHTDLRLVGERYQTYTKFLITRNPFERLLSAYTDKFMKLGGGYAKKFGPIIITANYLSDIQQELLERMRENLKKGSTQLNESLNESLVRQIKRLDAGAANVNITFREFLNYIIITVGKVGRQSLDYHWAPVSVICNPCSVRYDFIAKFETINEDSKALLDYVQADLTDNKVEFPKYQSITTKDRCNIAFANIPREMRNKLYELFKEDFILFDYQYNGDSSDDTLC